MSAVRAVRWGRGDAGAVMLCPLVWMLRTRRCRSQNPGKSPCWVTGRWVSARRFMAALGEFYCGACQCKATPLLLVNVKPALQEHLDCRFINPHDPNATQSKKSAVRVFLALRNDSCYRMVPEERQTRSCSTSNHLLL